MRGHDRTWRSIMLIIEGPVFRLMQFPFGCSGAPLIPVESLMETAPRVIDLLAVGDESGLSRTVRDLDIPDPHREAAIFHFLVGYGIAHPLDLPEAVLSHYRGTIIPDGKRVSVLTDAIPARPSDNLFLQGIQQALLDGVEDSESLVEAGMRAISSWIR
jgi:hypothetical protein